MTAQRVPLARRFLSIIVGERSRFFFLASFLFIALVASLRIFLVDYAVYHDGSTRDITALLEQESFPPREQAHHVVAAAVLSVREAFIDANPGLEQSKQSDRARRLHAAFAELVKPLAYDQLEPGSSEHAIRESYRLLALPDDGVTLDEWRDELRLLYQQYFALMPTQKPSGGRPVDCIQTKEIVACQGDVELRTRHERAFGSAGCDKPGVGARTSLVVASRSGCRVEPSLASLKAQSDKGALFYSRRLLQSNAVSLFMESILRAIGGLSADSVLHWDRSQLVQAYYLGSDSLLRYASVAGRDAYSAFGPARLWGASALIDRPILEHDRKKASEIPRSQYASAHHLGALRAFFKGTVPSTPYIDLGDHGLVRTECTPAMRGDEALLGLLCTDETVPLFPGLLTLPEPSRADDIAKEHGVKEEAFGDAPSEAVSGPFVPTSKAIERLPSRNHLFTATVIAIDPGPKCGSQGSVFALPLRFQIEGDKPWFGNENTVFSDRLDDEMVQAICERLEAEKGEFYRNVQPFPRPEEGSPQGEKRQRFLIPLARDGEPAKETEMRHLALLINPRPPEPPRQSLIIVLVIAVGLGLTVSLRMYVDFSSRRWSREQAILRNLQVGVLDVYETSVIEAANDRAEELLNARLPTMGARNDPADPQPITNFVHSRFLRRSRRLSQFVHLNLDELRRLRENGMAFPFYARRISSADAQWREADKAAREAGRREIKRLWLRVKGNPLFTPGASSKEGARTFAVLHTVSEQTAIELEEEFWTYQEQGGDDDHLA